eukprot:TRINITY_DN4778_c0_g1_i3.p1 TRINITY_DN4778_c0_g1~~TRINITY_DN4778_c0_g1_i3.p1  ORF type:complete len:153 (+),score=28.60 TRINITY_DN4778_c0_g1_i3:216-674(+)
MVEDVPEDIRRQEFRRKPLSEKIESTNVTMECYDTGGQEKFRTITGTFYQSTSGIVVVFDVNDRESFDEVDTFLYDIDRYAPKDSHVFLAGNKTDLDERKVSEKEAAEKADQINVRYIETSALTGDNIEELFVMVAKKIIASRKADLSEDSL